MKSRLGFRWRRRIWSECFPRCWRTHQRERLARGSTSDEERVRGWTSCPCPFGVRRGAAREPRDWELILELILEGPCRQYTLLESKYPLPPPRGRPSEIRYELHVVAWLSPVGHDVMDDEGKVEETLTLLTSLNYLHFPICRRAHEGRREGGREREREGALLGPGTRREKVQWHAGRRGSKWPAGISQSERQKSGQLFVLAGATRAPEQVAPPGASGATEEGEEEDGDKRKSSWCEDAMPHYFWPLIALPRIIIVIIMHRYSRISLHSLDSSAKTPPPAPPCGILLICIYGFYALSGLAPPAPQRPARWSSVWNPNTRGAKSKQRITRFNASSASAPVGFSRGGSWCSFLKR